MDTINNDLTNLLQQMGVHKESLGITQRIVIIAGILIIAFVADYFCRKIVVPTIKKGCIIIPQAATYELQNRIFVYKVVDGKAKSTPVEVFRLNNGTEYIVETGLEPGDVIIAEGAGLVREGTVIKSDPTKE